MIRLTRPSRVALGRMAKFWVYGTGPAALLLLLLAPAILPGKPWPFVLAYLGLPAYMLHQVEEYDAGLLRQATGFLGPDQPVLSLSQVAIINLGLAWMPLAATILLVAQVDMRWVVLAGWLMLMNTWLHLWQAAREGRYNPGLATAILLFLPLVAAIFAGVPATFVQHSAAFGLAALLHVLVIVVARGGLGRSE